MMWQDPDWPRASAWIGGEVVPPVLATLGMLDVPLGRASLSPGRCQDAPQAIREAWQRLSTYDFDAALDIRHCALQDAGAVPVEQLTPEEAFPLVRERVHELLRAAGQAVLLGGDNSITRPGVHGLGLPLSRCGLVTLDAHLDLRRLDDGLTNGNPVRALLADGLPGTNIVQIGLQSFANSPAYAALAREAGICVIPVETVRARGLAAVLADALELLAPAVEAIYFDLDLDVLDRALAPASPGARAGGLDSWEVLLAARICGAHKKVRVMDVVEVDPARDVAAVTVMTAAAAVLHFTAGLLTRQERHAR